MIKGYRGTDGDIEPVEFECEVFGFPHTTTGGDTMYKNTHFSTKEEAWDSINKSWEVGIHLLSLALKRYKGKVREYTDKVADDVLKSQESKEIYRSWLVRHSADNKI